jgi:predicted ATPase/DNA-binding SARP family transcriptional activator/Tfp pilus assembly protein PilF
VSEPRLQLLGAARFTAGSQVVTFSSDKRHALLAYLAFKNDWVAREQLAGLFWPDTDTTAARKNLRHLVQRTRALGWVQGFEAALEHLRWRVPSDVLEFRAAVRAHHWADVLRLHGGVLLEGFEGIDSFGFSDWLHAEREHLRAQWHAAGLEEARALDGRGASNEALRVLETMLAADGLDEDALHVLMRVAAQSEQRALALRRFESYQSRLRAELNLPPATHLEQLARDLRAVNAPTPDVRSRISASSPRPLTTLPSPTTPFIGREALLAEVRALLEPGGARLVTLVGVGGVGKTRVALQAALEHTQREVGLEAVFVNLVPLTQAAAVSTAIASSCGVHLQDALPVLEQVIAHIAGREVLVLLDNFEHLMAAKTDVARLLQSCPRLVVLVTSREALGLSGEHVIAVEPFSLPADPSPDAAEIARLESVRLFTYHAQRVRPNSPVARSDLPAVLEVCRLVDGLALAIELAAVWVRAMSVSEIAHELTQNLDLLSSHHASAEDRHRSVRAAFEHSWALLTPDERQALRRCAVFRGGFTRQAARVVAHVPLPVLASLIDKSLLSPGSNGRYRRHRLLHQFSNEKALEHPEEWRAARQDHLAYCQRLLQAGLEGIRGPDSKIALETIDLELDNIRAAWRWAIEQRHAAFFKSVAEALMRYFDAKGRYSEGLAMYAEALNALSADVTNERAALGALLVHRAKFLERRGELREAEQSTERGLALLPTPEDRETTIWGLGNLGTVHWRLGDFERAKAYRRTALEAARALGNERLTAVALGWMALSLDQCGDLEDAKAHYAQAIALFKALGNYIGALFNLNNLCDLLIDAREYGLASALLFEALALCRTSGEQSQIPATYAKLSICHRHLGQLEEALVYARHGLEAERERAETKVELTEYLRDVAHAAHALGDHALVDAALGEALGHAWDARALETVSALLSEWRALTQTASGSGLRARLEQTVAQFNGGTLSPTALLSLEGLIKGLRPA